MTKSRSSPRLGTQLAITLTTFGDVSSSSIPARRCNARIAGPSFDGAIFELPQPRSGSGARPSGHRVPSDDLSDRGQIEGESTPVSPGNVIEYEVPDMYGRPWEEGMEQPEDDDIFSFE